MDEITFIVIIHHGGRFQSSKRHRYVGGKATTVCENLDIDRLSYPEIMSYIKEDLGYNLDSISGLYYCRMLQDKFVFVQNDKTILEIANKLCSGATLDFYVDHKNSDHDVSSNLVQIQSSEEFNISQGLTKVIDEATQNSQAFVLTDNVDRGVENIVCQTHEELQQSNLFDNCDFEYDNQMGEEFPVLTFDNMHINVDFLTDDEEDELRQSRDNVRAFKRNNCWIGNKSTTDNDGLINMNENDNEIFPVTQVVEDDESHDASSEDDDSAGSFYYDSDDNCSYYSETDEECGDRALRRPSKIIRFDINTVIPIFCCGMVFQNVQECKDALAKYAIMKGVQVHFIKNDKVRVRAGCMEKCPWKFFASKDGGTDNFVVKTYIANHKCHRKNTNPMATSNYLAKHLKERLMATPYIKARELKELCKTELKLRISITQARNVKKKLLESLIGSYTEEFKRLHDYVLEINTSNPGTTCVVKTAKDEGGDINYFKRFYVCFAACKRGWVEGCRKIIGLDGCFLKGMCRGQLLCAIGRDGNDQMFPIAWAVVAVENKENWGWFINLLKYDLSLDDGADLTIISDMQKGLDSAINEYLPQVEHRMCARHVYAAWAKKWRGEERKIAFWSCSRSTFENELKANLQSLNLMGDKIVEDLLRYNVESFSKAYFRITSKCDSVDNNMAETFNGWILEARCKPIISMLEEIRTQVMRRLHIKRRLCKTWICDVGPRPMEKLEKNKELSYQWHMVWNGDDGYEVSNVYDHNNRHTVHLNSSRCSCRKWDLTGIPCQHAICAIYSAGKEPSDYMSHWYRKENYTKTYQYMMQTVRGKILWDVTGKEEIVPPPYRKLPGRPPKNRKKDKNEIRKTSRLSKRGKEMSCSICKQTGHNSRKCPQRTTSNVNPGRNQSVKRKDKDEAPRKNPSAELLKEFMSANKNAGRSITQVQHPSIGNQQQGHQSLPKQQRGKRTKINPKPKPTKVPIGYGCFVNQSTGEIILNPGTNVMQSTFRGSNVSSSRQQSSASSSHAPPPRGL